MVRKTRRQAVGPLDALAAAHAAQAHYDQAVQNAREALRLATQLGHEQLARQVQQRLELYEQKQPYREQ